MMSFVSSRSKSFAIEADDHVTPLYRIERTTEIKSQAFSQVSARVRHARRVQRVEGISHEPTFETGRDDGWRRRDGRRPFGLRVREHVDEDARHHGATGGDYDQTSRRYRRRRCDHHNSAVGHDNDQIRRDHYDDQGRGDNNSQTRCGDYDDHRDDNVEMTPRVAVSPPRRSRASCMSPADGSRSRCTNPCCLSERSPTGADSKDDAPQHATSDGREP